MADIKTLRDLRERVRKATGPLRELDASIMDALFDAKLESGYWDWQSSRPKGTPERATIAFWRRKATGITASIDAIRALIRKQFPNACITINEWAHRSEFGFSLGRYENDFATGNGDAATTPLAGCAALLTALISIEESKQEEGGNG